MNTGSCLCGAVRWRMEGPYARMTNCHCSMCRKAHGAPFATYIRTDTDKFEVLSGAESVTGYEASDNFKRRFCAHCGSVLWIGEGDQIGASSRQNSVDLIGGGDVAYGHGGDFRFIPDLIREWRLKHPAIDGLLIRDGLTSRNIDQVTACRL